MSTRRQFLSQAVGGVALLGVSGCRTAGSAGPTPVRAILALDVPPIRSTVALVQPSAYPTLVEAVREVISRAGGLGFIRAGQWVLIKPATNSPKVYPATADPEVVMEVARLVREAGGLPIIADRTMFARSTLSTFHALHFDDAAHQAGAKLWSLDDAPHVMVRHSLATHWDGEVPLYTAVMRADHVINLCTPRTHRLGDFTMAMKNNVGVVAGSSRLGMHLPGGFRERLAELSLVVRPNLVLMDGRQGFTDGGPDSGDLAQLDFLAASADPLAIDAVGLGYLRLAGANPTIARGSVWSLPVMKRAAELGVGAASIEAISLLGLDGPAEAKLRAQLF